MSRRRVRDRDDTRDNAIDAGLGRRWHTDAGAFGSGGVGPVEVKPAKRVGARLEREKRLHTRGGAIKIID
jgi:hypothetical protein